MKKPETVSVPSVNLMKFWAAVASGSNVRLLGVLTLGAFKKISLVVVSGRVGAEDQALGGGAGAVEGAVGVGRELGIVASAGAAGEERREWGLCCRSGTGQISEVWLRAGGSGVVVKRAGPGARAARADAGVVAGELGVAHAGDAGEIRRRTTTAATTAAAADEPRAQEPREAAQRELVALVDVAHVHRAAHGDAADDAVVRPVDPEALAGASWKPVAVVQVAEPGQM